jgi:hypothetical protein
MHDSSLASRVARKTTPLARLFKCYDYRRMQASCPRAVTASLSPQGALMSYLSPQTLTAAEQRRLRRATAARPRDHLIFSLALGRGLRLAEIVGLNIAEDRPPGRRTRNHRGLLETTSAARDSPRPRPRGETRSCTILGVLGQGAVPSVAPPTSAPTVSETPDRPRSSARKGASATPPPKTASHRFATVSRMKRTPGDGHGLPDSRPRD